MRDDCRILGGVVNRSRPGMIGGKQVDLLEPQPLDDRFQVQAQRLDRIILGAAVG